MSGIGPQITKHGPVFVRDSTISPSAVKTRSRAEAGTRKSHSYRPLPREFRRDRFHYRQIAREADIAIYEQRWCGCVEPSVAYEVIRIRHRDGFQIHGRFVEPSELYPNSEAWGTDGFTFTDKDVAFKKLRVLAQIR
jgi:hypothetical protein